jgi:O-antigen ligase
MRGVFETLIVYTAISTFITSWESITKLFAIYFASFVFFGVWGIAGGGLVRQHMPLSDEDSFGPFMSIGFGMSCFLLRWRGWRNERKLVLMAAFISLAGAISSFARGTFVALAGVVTLLFIRARNKVRFLSGGVMIALLALALAWVVVPRFVQEYYEEVSTIWIDGTEEKTANDRLYLWTRGIAMFWDHPIFGVGPGCYGYRLPSYITRESAREWGVRFQMYGRSIHNIYLEVLATMGLLGSLALAGLLVSFRARNVSIRQARVAADAYLVLGREREPCRQMMLRCSLALEAGMVAFLLNGVFFNILEYTWFWDLLILNTLVFRWAKTAERVPSR